jgi:hypothetical protein
VNDSKREPTYRTAYDSAQQELSQIYERFGQLRARQEKIQAVSDALKLLIANDQAVDGAPNASPAAAKTVFEINSKDFFQGSQNAQNEPEEESKDRLQQHLKKALRMSAHP